MPCVAEVVNRSLKADCTDFNCEAASEPLLPKVARCIPVLPSRHIGKCAARVLKRSGPRLSIVSIFSFLWTDQNKAADR